MDVCISPLPQGLDGLAVTSGRLRLALVSSGISATRQRFTLAHELGHLVAGDAQELRVDEDVFGKQPVPRQPRRVVLPTSKRRTGAIRRTGADPTDGVREDRKSTRTRPMTSRPATNDVYPVAFSTAPSERRRSWSTRTGGDPRSRLRSRRGCRLRGLGRVCGRRIGSVWW